MQTLQTVFIVYIKTDEKNRICAVDSSAFIGDATGWIEIDSGSGFRHKHAQCNYFPKPIHDRRGIMRYLYTPDGDTLWRERTQDEMDADYVEPIVPIDPKDQKIAQLEEQVAALSAAFLNL